MSITMKAWWRGYRAAPAVATRQVVFAIHTAFLFQAVVRGLPAQGFQEWCFLVLPTTPVMWAVRRVGPAWYRPTPHPA